MSNDEKEKKKSFMFSNPFARKEEKELPTTDNNPPLNNNNSSLGPQNNNSEGFNPFSRISGFMSSRFGQESKPENHSESSEKKEDVPSFNPFSKFGQFFQKEQKVGFNIDTATYEEVLQYALEQDFEVENSFKFLYIAGYDILQRPVLVTNTNTLPKDVNFDRLLLYVVKVMDKIVESDYAIIYIRSEGTRPGFGWLRKAYKLLGRKYKKNLKALYVVHPTFWVKGIMKLFKPFISQKFWQKLHYIEEISELYKFVPRENIAHNLPQSIFQAEASKFKTAIFGATIEEVMGRPDHDNAEVPWVVENCIRYLAENDVHIVTGIFRLSGSSKVITDLRKDFNTKKASEISLNEIQEVHAISGLLKQFLRETPEPLFPYDMYSLWMNGITKTNRSDLIDFFKDFCSHMPIWNQSILRHLLAILYFISANSEINQMTANNLSIVISPNIIRTPSSVPPEEVMKHGSVHSTLFSKMITYTPDIFPVLSKDKPTCALLNHLLTKVSQMPTSQPIPFLNTRIHENNNNNQIQKEKQNNQIQKEDNQIQKEDNQIQKEKQNNQTEEKQNNQIQKDDIFDDLGEIATSHSEGISDPAVPSTAIRNRSPALKPAPLPPVVDQPRSYGKCLCEYDFTAGEDAELSFNAGDMLLILTPPDDQKSKEWWEALNPTSGLKGLIPNNYVKMI